MNKIFTLMLVCFCSIAAMQAQSQKTVKATNDLADDITGLYTGTLTVDLSIMSEDPEAIVVNPDQVIIDKFGTDKINITLKDFSFAGLLVGDIFIDEISVVKKGDVYAFESKKVPLLILGMINAEVKVIGDINNGKSDLFIDVQLINEGDDPTPIPVTFLGEYIDGDLRLTDLKINGSNLDGFQSDIFNCKEVVIQPTDIFTYTVADPQTKVSVKMDGDNLYLYLTNAAKKSYYTIVNPLNDELKPTPITKITIGQSIDGDLILENGAQIEGNATVAGTITYTKAIKGNEWNVIGLPYALASVTATNTSEASVNIDALWYTYNHEGKQVELTAPSSSSIMKSQTDAVSLSLVSVAGSSIKGSTQIFYEGYNVVANNTLTNITLSDMIPTRTAITFYTFNGTEFVQVAGSTTIPPATMFIAYNGASPATSIAAPDTSLGLENGNSSDKSNAYAVDGRVYIKNFTGTAKVYTLNGAGVLDKAVNVEADFGLPTGTYIIQIGSKGTVVRVK